MSNKSSSSRRKTAQSLVQGRRPIFAGSFGNALPGKKLCRKRVVAVNKQSLRDTKPPAKEPLLLTGKMRPKHVPTPGPYALCSCGSGRKVKWCANIGICIAKEEAPV